MLHATNGNGRLYHALLASSWTQRTVCLDGTATAIPLLFRLYPVDPHAPADSCQHALLAGTLHLAFTATGQIDVSNSSIDLGGGGGDVEPL